MTNRNTQTIEITFREFLNEVATENLAYAAERYNVTLAQAVVAAAREFQNPVLQLNGGRDVSHSGTERLPDILGTSLTQTIETGGKRKYRILAARQNSLAVSVTLEDFLRNLKLDAAAAFADALAKSRNVDQKRESATFLESLLQRQQERFKGGDISNAEMLQTRVEEQQFKSELTALEAEADNARMALSAFLGRDKGQTLLMPRGTLEISPRDYDAGKLLAAALEHRPDLIALRHQRDASRSRIREERAKRIPNVDLGAGWTHTSSSFNTVAPAPAADSLALSVGIPLPIWNRNKAGIANAEATAEQMQKQLEAAELKAEVQIRQTLTIYQGAVERVKQYQTGILQDAEAVLESKRFSYQRGQTTLLDLLSAQRTANEVRTSYNDALAEQAKALVELERAALLWDIDLNPKS